MKILQRNINSRIGLHFQEIQGATLRKDGNCRYTFSVCLLLTYPQFDIDGLAEIDDHVQGKQTMKSSQLKYEQRACQMHLA